MRLLEFYKLVEASTATVEFQEYIREKYGILFDLREINPGVVDIESMQNIKRERGLGTQAMEELIAWADAREKMLTLGLAEKGYSPDPKGPKTSSSGRLAKFYRRFGFVPNKGRNKRHELSWSTSMYRQPAAKKRKDQLEIEAGITDSYKGESFGYVRATLGDRAVGTIEFSYYDNEGIVNWIKTAEGMERRGIATRMVKYLHKWLDAPISFTSTTDTGGLLGKRLRTQGMIEGRIMEERILQAAFVDPATGVVYPVGYRHLLQPLLAHGVPEKTIEKLLAEPNQGFVTDQGRWIDRRTAAKLVQLNYDEMDSRDIPKVRDQEFDINKPHKYRLAWNPLDMPEGDNDENSGL